MSTSQTTEMSIASLKDTVREWVRMDNQVRALNRELSHSRLEKKKMSEQLVKIMRENQLDQFDLKDGQIMYVRKNVKKPINQKQLLSILASYYQGDTDKAQEVGTYILSNREEVVKESIKRVVDGSSNHPNGSSNHPNGASTGNLTNQPNVI